jgi:NADPH:quinone reductase-like Zn-dependent oxidoreductase
MKASFRSSYGSAEVLSIQEIPKPVPKDDEVLIKVHAASVSRTDLHVLTGKPGIMKLFTGLTKPRSPVTGSDFAGEIESTGKDVTGFKTGDKVMGFSGVFGTGSHAEYKTFKEKKGIVLMPENLSYVEAAACVEGAFYAIAGLDQLNLQSNQNVLVVGGTGAIGSAMIQFLKLYGVHITAVCRGEHSELVKSLGADKIIDYQNSDYTKVNEQYDFVFDTIGTASFGKVKRILKEKGGFFPGKGFINFFLAITTRIGGGKRVLFSAPKKLTENLNLIGDLAGKEKFKPLIDRKYPLEKIGEAFYYVASGQKVGNVILTISD